MKCIKFIFQLTEYAITPMIYFFLMYHGYSLRQKKWNTTDIFRTCVCGFFLRVNATFYDAINIIHDVIRTANLLLDSCLSVSETINLIKSDIER